MMKLRLDTTLLEKDVKRLQDAAPYLLSNAISAALTPLNKSMKNVVPVQTGYLKNSIGKARSIDKEQKKVSGQIIIKRDAVKPAGTYYFYSHRFGKRVKRTQKEIPVWKYGLRIIKKRKLNEQASMIAKTQAELAFTAALKRGVESYYRKMNWRA
jgi:hypothetical protein